ncbi:insulinase family protein [Acholeplasma sp. OttesenSCG-928-E16]|nr:insulinase family protein [Acholeplasma sp. OttesenSCG-928-E16]
MPKTRFKAINLVAVFLYEPTKKNYVLATLLDDIIVSHTDNHQNEQKMAILKQEMYGSRITVASDYYASLYSAFMISIPNPRLVDDANLFSTSIEVLKELIYAHNNLNIEIFNNRKRMILEAFLSLKNDKRRFSRVVFSDEILRDTILPTYQETIDIIKETTLDDFMSFYLNTVLKGKRVLLANGPLTDDENSIFFESFKQDEITHESPYSFLEDKEPTLYRSDILALQTEICLSYKTVIKDLNESMAANLANIILGGAFESRLFLYIREELGLCYDISSRYNRNFSLLSITAGVDPKNVDIAYQEIKKTIDQFIEKGINSDELSLAKEKAKSALLSRSESQMSYINDHLENIISGLDNSIENKFLIINKMTLNEVNKFISTLKPYHGHIFRGNRND